MVLSVGRALHTATLNHSRFAGARCHFLWRRSANTPPPKFARHCAVGNIKTPEISPGR
jgi:hypothetical protein